MDSNNTLDLPLPGITQDWIDRYGWYGTLLLLKQELPKDSLYLPQLNNAIALCQPKYSFAQVLATFSEQEIFDSLLNCAEHPTQPVPKGLLDALKK